MSKRALKPRGSAALGGGKPQPGAVAPHRPRADYDATVDKRKRTTPRSIIKIEEEHLTDSNRRRLSATAQDQIRNFAIAGWMVRKHCAYVSRFRFRASNHDRDGARRDDGFKRALEQYIYDRGRNSRFDAAGKLDMPEALTRTEMHAVLHGDAFWHLLADGSTQCIEGDLVHTPHDLPAGLDPDDFVQGVEADKRGRHLSYILCERDGSSRQFGLRARAANVLQRAHWPVGRLNGLRGVSPISSAINTLQDLYESFDYSLIKAKLHALFGVAILHDLAENNQVGGFAITESTESSATDTDVDGNATTRTIKENILKPGVATVFDLPAGAKVDMLESSHPAGEFMDYGTMMIHVALAALDIPMIFYDAKEGSFSIHRTARMEYEISCKSHRDDVEELADRWTLRQVQRGVLSGDLTLPRGWDLNDVGWDYIPDARPWFDEGEYIDSTLAGVAGGIVDPIRAIRENGGDEEEVISNIARLRDLAAAKGLTLVWGQAPITLTASSGKDRSND